MIRPRDSRCSICADAHQNFVCAPCRKEDPDWNDGDERLEADEPTGARAPWEAPPWAPTELYQRVVRALITGASRREAAREAECSVAYVQKVAEEVGL